MLIGLIWPNSRTANNRAFGISTSQTCATSNSIRGSHETNLLYLRSNLPAGRGHTGEELDSTTKVPSAKIAKKIDPCKCLKTRANGASSLGVRMVRRPALRNGQLRTSSESKQSVRPQEMARSPD